MDVPKSKAARFECPASRLQFGRSIDTEWNGVNAHHGDLHAVVERTHLLELAVSLAVADRQADEALQGLAAIGVNADMMPVERAMLGTDLAQEVAREGGLAILAQRGNRLHDIPVRY